MLKKEVQYLTNEGFKMNRYDRQIRVDQIGLAGQEKIKQAVILIVGCGALGTYAAEQLIRTGVQHLILIDPDIVEETNLQRQTLFTTKDAQAQKAKVTAAKEKLLQVNPKARIDIYQERFDSALFHQHKKIHLILDCTDNYLARRLINDYCLAFNLPFIFASVASTSGQVMPLFPSEGPCLSCVFPQLHQLEKKGCDTIGVITPIVPLISSIQISLCLQYLVGDLKNFHTLHMVESWPLKVSSFQVNKQTDCLMCNQKQSHTSASELTETCGEVFQTTFPFLSLEEIEGLCIDQKLTYQKNPIAIKMQLGSFEITFFKNGHTLFYGFTETEAKETFGKIKKYLAQLHP
ncbi:HesA/MoeB/ThiF family protein [Tetragenococcus halophilus]|uniref:HesA/MoeB/ThiF family protein n=1 Tax=Tetragenococcus halophilus TaxID=51669 RepID=UPI00295F2258|nr:HesA/MoeB/ThiF family protein [Tetragenococcus halophilus]